MIQARAVQKIPNNPNVGIAIKRPNNIKTIPTKNPILDPVLPGLILIFFDITSHSLNL